MALNILIFSIPDKLPAGMEQAIAKLRKTRSKEECLRKAYETIRKRFVGKKFYYATHPLDLFVTDLDRIWNQKKVLNCTTFNYLLRALLLKSGKFAGKDLRNRWTLVWNISPHQYTEVNTGKRKVVVDLWGASNGIPLGKYAR
jgi:hypothetical protein